MTQRTIKFIFYLDLDRSMRFEEVKGRYDSKDIEANIENFWDKINAYEKQKGKKSDKKFFFVDGPPYTTGNIHLGTAWNKIIKDAILRYKRMDGFSVTDRPGWDMHGLPIEVKVEEELKFKSKKDIERYGVAEFVEKCIKFALSQKENMTEQFKSLGVWMDWENPYVSIDPGYMESAWWTLKEAYKRDLLKEGFGVVNWCPRCETAIAESEVEYEDMKDPSIYVLFPLISKTFGFWDTQIFDLRL
ncbi:MAG: Isoleucine--tRNA ligase [Candidatus Methanolliviera sp. GoM_oil]|nr:MAG: Isoleucine--tRNA ligase [Candidatus Methanolliviera sp. GoM_oil]